MFNRSKSILYKNYLSSYNICKCGVYRLKNRVVYRLMVHLVFTLIILSILPSAVVNSEKRSQTDSKDVVEISILFPGFGKEFGNRTLKISKEKYVKLGEIFNVTLESLEKAETDEEICRIFNETIVKLKDMGILSGIDIKRLQRLVINRYLKSKKYTQFLEKLSKKFNISDKVDNLFCLICGRADANRSFDIDLLSRIYDFGVRLPISITALVVAMLLRMLLPSSDSLENLLDFLCWIPIGISFIHLQSPLPVFGALYLGAEEIIIYDPNGKTYLRPAHGHVWTKGLKGVKVWDGTFYGNFSILFYPYYPILSYSLLLIEYLQEKMPQYSDILNKLSISLLLLRFPILIFMYSIFLNFRWCVDWLPAALGYNGIFIKVPSSYSFFIGYAHAVSIKYADF